LFLAPQSNLGKNENAVRKGLARNAQIRGVFGPPPSAEDYLGDARTSECQFGLRMAKNGAYEADTLCLEYAILFQWDAVPAMQYRQANIFQTTPQYMCCSQKQMAHQLFS
jgi:hypothetical protein